MKIPVLEGVIDRRILINYKVEMSVLRRMLPAPFQPINVHGYGIVGVCLIRLKDLRVKGIPRMMGYSSENAAYRIAVEWKENGLRKTGVYLPQIYTSSYTNVLAGGRIFPGTHHLTRFTVKERGDQYLIHNRTKDGLSLVINARTTSYFPRESVFKSLDKASAFFKKGTTAYSPRYKQEIFDGLEFLPMRWAIMPLHVSEVYVRMFEDQQLFPQGSAFFDHALLMKNIPHEWHKRRELLAPRPVRW